MRLFVSVILLHSASAVIHSLKYFSVGSCGLANLPEFVCVGQLNGVEMVRYDSNTKRLHPTQDWINNATADDPDHWRQERENLRRLQHYFKQNMVSLRQHFNQSGGVHMLQKIHGCEWDNETRVVNGCLQWAYDGEDFISFDLKTQTWIPQQNQALIIKHLWDKNRAGNILLHHFLSKECRRRLRKYLDYGNSSLLRTEVPSVFLRQRSPWSPISCLATGFYPNRARLFWTKDGEELHQGVDIGGILPNHDGTFQRRAYLSLSSDEDRHRYQCVFQFSGVKEKLVTKLDKASFRTNSDDTIPIVLGVFAALLFLGGGGAAFFICRKKQQSEKGASHPVPLAGDSLELKRKLSSSSGTVMQAAGRVLLTLVFCLCVSWMLVANLHVSSDSALSLSADSEAPTKDSSVRLMEDCESDADSGTELKTASQIGSYSSTGSNFLS